jgi:hypothetical protein
MNCGEPISIPLGEQHVRRLEITVHDTGRVDGLQGLSDPGDQPEYRRFGHRAVVRDGLPQGRSWHVGGRQPRWSGGWIGIEQLRGI